MPSSPLVSVVMSVFNGERFLAEAVESILNQSFRDFEFIVIDDGLMDSSGAILDSYEKKDSRLRVYPQENRGLVESLNRGCSLARGKYIARMDADDIAVPDRLSWQVDFMEKHPEVAVLGGAMEVIDAAGNSLLIGHYPVEDHEIKAILCHDCCMAHPTVLIRKEVLTSVGGYRKGLVDAEDYDLWLRIAGCAQLANLKPVVLKYRVHPNQVSRRKLEQQVLSTLAAQAAASARGSGNRDPLNAIGEITPQVLAGLGVSEAAQQRALGARYLTWIGTMSLAREHSIALNLWRDMLRTCQWEYVDRRVIAHARLAVAGIYWKQNRFLQSLLITAQAVITRPVVAGRPLKLLWRRLEKAFKMRSSQGGSGA